MRSLTRVLSSGAVLAALSLASLVHAATFTVTQFDDPAPGACDANCSLREAVIAANASVGVADIIQLSTGTYNLTIPEDGTEDGGSLDVNDDVTIQGDGPDLTIINGVQPALNGRILEVDFSADNVTIDGVTIQGGRAPGSPGGGVLAPNTTLNLLLSNCRLTDNLANSGGGLSSNAITILRNCRFDNNDLDATGTNGAGVDFSSSGSLTVENCVFDNNEISADSGEGAGLSFSNGASLNISGSTFESNRLLSNGRGAGLFCTGGDPVTVSTTQFLTNSITGGAGAGAGLSCGASPLLLDGITVSGNTTDGGDFAAMEIGGGPLTTLQNSVVEGNRITAGDGRYPGGFLSTAAVEIFNSTIRNNVNEGGGDGGGIWVVGGLTVVGSTFSGNQTNGNVGALNLESSSINVVNSTFNGNEAGLEGGAIRISTGTGSFNNVTISGNTASGPGGGVFFTSFTNFTIRNSILSNNQDDGSGPDCNSTDTVTSGGYNLIGMDTGCLIDPPEGDPASTDIYGANPLLGALADNGGPTETMALLPGSPAIDAGNPAGCTDQNGDPLTTDQRGAARPFGTRCDIGAFEFGSAPPGTSNLAIVKTVDNADVFLDAQVTFTLSVENQGPSDNTNVVATDTLPAGFTLVSATGAGADCVTSGNQVTCTAASLAADAGFTVTIVATAGEAGDWVNTAEVSGDAEESDPANNQSSVTVTISGQFPVIRGGGCMLRGEALGFSSLPWIWLIVTAGLLFRRINGKP